MRSRPTTTVRNFLLGLISRSMVRRAEPASDRASDQTLAERRGPCNQQRGDFAWQPPRPQGGLMGRAPEGRNSRRQFIDGKRQDRALRARDEHEQRATRRALGVSDRSLP